MQPDAMAEFVYAFGKAMKAERRKEVEKREQTRTALAETARKLQDLYDAIADGFRTPGLCQKLEGTKATKTELEAQLSALEPSPMRLHPGLPEMYRRKVADLATSLKDASIRTRALNVLRGLIERVSVHASAEGGGPVLELEGAIYAIIEEAQPGALSGVDHGSVKVAAED